MDKQLLLDTNILLDALVDGRPEHDEARRVLAVCNGGGDMGIVSPNSLSDTYYLLRRDMPEAHARQADSYEPGATDRTK